MLVPLAVLEAGIPASLSAAKDKPVVVYCGNGSTRGPEGTHLLHQTGFSQAVNLRPGLEGWAKAGLPIAAGAA